MPLPDAADIPPPASWEEFEELCCELWRRIWNDPGWSREFLDLAGSAPDFPYPSEPPAADRGPSFDE